ncbi:MAG TPA: rRNA maturation RNase YbeY [Puia sp.]|nr:rRNA maturation RNase YbeY [Puia sp.]
MAKVFFSYADRNLHIVGKTAIKASIERLFHKEKKPLERIQYIFCSDDWLWEMNRGFLQHDTYTDILSFDLSEPGTGIRGEIYISLDRVRDNARKLGVPFKEELCRVVFHGALHLCGYKDHTKREKLEMRGKEDQYLRLYAKSQP